MNLPQGFLPVLALKNTVIFPGMTQLVKVGRKLNIKSLEYAKENGFWIVASLQKSNFENEVFGPQDLSKTGTLCLIESIRGNQENGYQAVLRGVQRVHIEELEFHLQKDFIWSNSSPIQTEPLDQTSTKEALVNSIKSLALQILERIPGQTTELQNLIQVSTDLQDLVDLCSFHLQTPIENKQELLMLSSLKERTLRLLTLMQDFKDQLDLQIEIQSKINRKMGQSQREGLLREHLKTIQQELGEDSDDKQSDRLRKKLDNCKIQGHAKDQVETDWRRLQNMNPQSPEAQMLRSYLEVIAELPWDKASESQSLTLTEAAQALDEDHEGLEKIKKRIIQQLAVIKLRKQQKGSLLLFVGPPGVGKTSLAQSIAKVLGRKFARISLGGVRDESDIRGHRRTYVGAMPGRVIQALKRAGEKNAVILLDEIDKMGRGYAGDPAAALLEVLDPEQNQNFTDHYLDLAFDLSDVFFIATANSLESIPAPLLDRLETIELSGYTSSEKLGIAKKHLIPKLQQEFGINKEQIEISDTAILKIITHYTREAGVRDLKRKIESTLRHLSEKVIELQERSSTEKIRIESTSIEEILGAERYSPEVSPGVHPAGVVTGLAWSPHGGDLLFIESTAMKGSGRLTITGQLGDVMKESVQIAQSLIRSHLPELTKGMISLDLYDLHVHVPSGATPKDGPSAGITIFISLASLITNRRLPPTLAMTGEITLRGAVSAVGGIKEKVLAAHRGGITEVILPLKNKADLKEVPDEIQKQMKFHFVSRVEEVLKIALGLETIQLEPKLLVEVLREPLVQHS